MSESPLALKVTDYGASIRTSESTQNIQTNCVLPPLTFQGIIDDKIKERSLKALSLYKAGDLEGAKKEYKKLIFLSPKNPEFHAKYAEVLEKTNDVQNALIHYKRAQSITDGKDVNQKVYELMLKKGHTMIGNNHFNNIFEPAADSNISESDFDISSLNTSMNLKFAESDKTQAYFIRALAYLSENKNGKAIEELNKCTNNDSKNVYAFILKAKIYWNLNQVKKGYQEFWRASEINADHPEVKEFLKLVKEKTKKLYDSAIKYFWEADYEKSLYFINKGMEIEPKSVKLLLLRSLIYRKDQKFDQALKDIEAASLALKDFPELEDEIKKNLAVTYNEMGIQMMSREDYTNAISLFDEALKFKSNDWGIATNKGDCYFKMKKYDMAKDQYNLAYLINTKSSALNARIGLCCFYTALDQYKLKKYYRCMQLIDEALKWDSSNTEYMCFKGKVSLILSDPKTAFQSYKAATIASPDHKEAIKYLSQFPIEMGKGEKLVLEKIHHKNLTR